jgi:hypothetical protein
MGHVLLVETDTGDRVLMLGRRELLLEAAVEGGADEASARYLEVMHTDDGCVLLTVDPQLGLRLVVRWRVRPLYVHPRPRASLDGTPEPGRPTGRSSSR